MKTNQALYGIIALLMALVLSGTLLSVDAQDGWPEGCKLPVLEESMSAANDAQADGDVASFVNQMGAINRLIDEALAACVVSALLEGEDLSSVDLSEANLVFTSLWHARMEQANLSGAALQAAALSNANLRGATLNGTNLQYALLLNSDLQSATIFDANLQWTVLRGANFDGATLNGANLQGSDLFEANLQRADLSAANLQGADLTNANLRMAYLDAIFNETSILPDGSNWTPDTDMSLYTDPAHPDFWDPCVEAEIPPQYCEDSGG